MICILSGKIKGKQYFPTLIYHCIDKIMNITSQNIYPDPEAKAISCYRVNILRFFVTVKILLKP